MDIAIEDSDEYPIDVEVVRRIEGALEVASFLGRWPSFRDMEVVRLSFDRLHETSIYNDLIAEFFIFDLAIGCRSPHGKQAYLEMLFRDLNDLRVEGWAHQNPIRGMSLKRLLEENEPAPGGIAVSWGGCGHEVAFRCRAVSVLRLRAANPYQIPWDEHRGP